MAEKAGKNIYLDIMKVKEWEDWCEKTGRVLSKVIPIAMKDYIENNK